MSNHVATQLGEKPTGNIRLPPCRFCKSKNVVKRGQRKTMKRGHIKRFGCNECHRTFCIDDGFFRMRNHHNEITKAIDLYFSNLSSRKVRNQYKRHENLKVSHVSVLDWCRRYALKVYKYTETLKPRLSGYCYADDTQIDRAGHKDHFWACVDWDTRFINAIHYSTHSGEVEASAFLEKAGRGLPHYIQTDAAQFYPAAFRKTFYNNAIRGLVVEHRINNVSKTKKHNVRIETVFMKIKDRVDDFRGLKAVWSAPILLAGVTLQHNFIEEHTMTGKIPAELAEITTSTGCNRWLELIRHAATT